MRAHPLTTTLALIAVSSAGGLLGGCTRDGKLVGVSMWNNTRLKPMEGGPLPSGLAAARPVPPGTVARGELAVNDPLRTGRKDGELLTKIPFPVTKEVLDRGRDRFEIFCAPCHGRYGDGEGMIVRRGFPHPPDYAVQRLRDAPVGHFYSVITHGYGVMYSYAARLSVRDRWAVAAYIRALQAARPEIPVDKYSREGQREPHAATPAQF